MSEKVSAFWPVEIGQFKYLFFIVNWNDFSNSITESLERNLDIFGQEIGLAGSVVQAYRTARWETYNEVNSKEGWPYDMHARFDSEQYPFMLIIDTNFKDFDPKEDKWSVIWFSDFKDNPDSISEIFSVLVRKTILEEDLFDFFKSLKAKQAAKGLIGYFEIKPGVFGCSVDVKAILADLGRNIQRNV